MGIEELKEVLALPFKSKNKYCMSEKEFIFNLSFDLRLYTPSESKEFLKLGQQENLLSIKDQLVRPSIIVLNHKTSLK